MTMIAPFDLLSRSHSRRFKSPVYRKNWNEGKIFGTSRSSVKVSGVAWKNVTSIRGISLSQLYTHVRQYANSLENKIYIYIYKERESFLVSTGKKKKRKKRSKIRNDPRDNGSVSLRKLVPTWRYCIEPTRPRISINNGKAALTTTTIRRLSFRAPFPPPVGRTAGCPPPPPPHGGVHT